MTPQLSALALTDFLPRTVSSWGKGPGKASRASQCPPQTPQVYREPAPVPSRPMLWELSKYMQLYLENMQWELIFKIYFYYHAEGPHFILVLTGSVFCNLFKSMLPLKSLLKAFFPLPPWNLNIDILYIYLPWPFWKPKVIVAILFTPPKTIITSMEVIFPPLKIHRLDKILWMTEHICILFLRDIKIINHFISCPETVRSSPPYPHRLRSYKTKEHGIKKI